MMASHTRRMILAQPPPASATVQDAAQGNYRGRANRRSNSQRLTRHLRWLDNWHINVTISRIENFNSRQLLRFCDLISQTYRLRQRLTENTEYWEYWEYSCLQQSGNSYFAAVSQQLLGIWTTFLLRLRVISLLTDILNKTCRERVQALT